MMDKKLGILMRKTKTKTSKHSKRKEAEIKASAPEMPTLNASTKIKTPLIPKQNSNYDVGKSIKTIKSIKTV